MKLPGKSRKLQRGITFIELLVAALLITIGIRALVGVWLFSFRMTINTDDSVMAYTVGRFTMERVKITGFGSAEGTSDQYFDGKGTVVAATAATRKFRVTTSVTSDRLKSGVAGQAGAVPENYALRTVVVTVRLVNTTPVLYTTQSYLVRAGI